MSAIPFVEREAAQETHLQTGNSARGFSLVELLVTIVIAAIFFAGIIYVFNGVLKGTAGDAFRVDSTNIAQDRIEQIRLLPYDAITANNLNFTPSPAAQPFGDGRFGPTYRVVGRDRPYTVSYQVDPANNATAPQKHIKVLISRPGTQFIHEAETVIESGKAGNSSTSDPEPTNLSLTIWFDNYKYVESPGVYIKRLQTNVTPNVVTTVAPASQMPTATNQRLTWTGLIGGPNYTYTVYCCSSKATYVMKAPSFRLWKTGSLKFDTYPGGD